MPGNNPNQNASMPQNKAKPAKKGFPGMATPEKHGARSSQEVADTRKENVATTESAPARNEKKNPL